MTAAVLFSGGVFINTNKKVVDINHFHVSLAHAHSSVLKATARQHDIQLVEGLTPCSGCLMSKGIRAPTPHRTTSRAAAPLDMVHIDTAGPFPESLGGSQYVVMFVDSASRFQRPYGTRDKSDRPSFVWYSGLWQTWELLERSGQTTAPSTPTRHSWSTVTVSKSAAS